MKDKIERLEKEILELTKRLHTDILTQVNNRIYLEEVEASKWDNKECYVYFIDSNNLKTINDKYGHNYGDIYLRELAQELKQFGNVIRYGGDEFIIISEEIITELSTNDKYSVGLAVKDKEQNLLEVINLADINMYNSKRRLR